MPVIGEIRKATDVGFKTHENVMWCACIDCGKERWVIIRKGSPQSQYCHSCCQRGVRNYMFGKTHSEDARRKISEYQHGKVVTEETKQKISKSRLERKETLGYLNSQDARKKISEAKKGKKQSQESIRKRVEKIKGLKRSEETKRKMSEAQKGEKSWNWKGEICVSSRGYVEVYQPDRPRALKGRVRRCDLVWESYYGTIPKDWVVHHVNGSRTDDRIENLCALEFHYHNGLESRIFHSPIDFVIEPGINPAIKDTWQYIASLKSRRETEELADFIFTLQMNPKIAKDFGAFIDDDLKHWLSHIVPAYRSKDA